MADNVTLPGTGAPVATDEVAGTGEHVQLVKLAASADGSRVVIPADGQGLTVKHADSLAGSASNLAAALNSALTWPADGDDSMLAYIVTGTTGTVIWEATVDGTNWFTHPMTIQVGTTDLKVSAGVTPATGMVFRVACNGFHSVRLRVSSALGAALSVYSVRSIGVTFMKAMDMAPSPHNLGYALVNRCAQYTAAQTGTALWTPGTGRRIAVTSVQIQGYGTTAGTVILWFGGSADTTYSIGTDAAIFDGEFAQSATNKPGVILTPSVPYVGATDFVLRVTTTNAQSVRFNVWGYEFV
jgi:hypothetical protein